MIDQKGNVVIFSNPKTPKIGLLSFKKLQSAEKVKSIDDFDGFP